MTKIKSLLLITIMLLVSGCGTKVPFKAQEPLDGAALLYVYVVDKMSNDDSMQDSTYKLQINGKNVKGALEAGSYKVFDMKPDTILVTAMRRNIEENNVKVTMSAGNSYFLKIESGSFGGAYTFKEVSKSEGQSGIAKTTLAGAFGVDTTVFVSDFAGSTAGEEAGTVAVPAMTEAEIDAIIEKKLNARSAAVVPVVAPVTTPAISKSAQMDELERAFSMKEKGMITQDEYNTMKSEILGK